MKLEEKSINGENITGNESHIIDKEESQAVNQLEEEFLNIIENEKGIESKESHLEEAEAHAKQTFQTRLNGIWSVIQPCDKCGNKTNGKRQLMEHMKLAHDRQARQSRSYEDVIKNGYSTKIPKENRDQSEEQLTEATKDTINTNTKILNVCMYVYKSDHNI